MRKIILCLLIIATSSCGFKVVKHAELFNFYIEKIETVGDARINFVLRNKLQQLGKDLSKNKINLTIKTKRNKTVKEKNSKNEITKYLITLNLELKVLNEMNDIKIFSFTEQIDYNVNIQNSQTIINEKQAVKTLIDLSYDRIIKELSFLNLQR